MKVLGVITARGGSKGIPHKNIVDLCGKPLIEYTITPALNSILDRVILSTDCYDIANVSKKIGVEVPFMRPDDLASDNAKSIDVVMHALEFVRREGYYPDAVMILQPTSPFRTVTDINQSIITLSNNILYDSLVSVTSVPHNFNPESIFNIENDKILNKKFETKFSRQEKLQYFARNGAAIYLTRCSVYDEKESREGVLGKCVFPYRMSKVNSLDIDDIEDLEIARAIINYRNENACNN